MQKGYIYTNHNGNASIRPLTGDEIANMTIDSFEDLFSPLLTGDIFSIPAVQRLLDKTPPRTNSSVSNDYPPSKKIMNEHKQITWKVGLCGLSEEDVYSYVDGSKIHVEVLNDAEPNEEAVVDYRNLHLPKKGDRISFKFDPTFYNPESIKVALKNGLMVISIDPREEFKPITKDLLGKKPEEKPAEKLEESENKETEKSDE